jgi:hypothetical protein
MSDRRLISAYLAREREYAEGRAGRAPATFGEAVQRYGWTTRDVQRITGKSARSARRYVQEGRLPGRGAAAAEVRQRVAEAGGQAEAGRVGQRAEAVRSRIASRGLRALSVMGRYRVSRSEYETRSPVEAKTAILGRGDSDDPGMAQVYELLDAGDMDGAEDQLAEVLSNAYQMSGGSVGDWVRVDSLNFTIR